MATQTFFVFTQEKLGKIPILTHIFQMGGPTTNQRLDDILFFWGLEKKNELLAKTAEDFCWTHFFLLQGLFHCIIVCTILQYYIYT